MIVHGNQMAHIEARTPSIERRFVSWSGNPWTPEQMAAAMRQHPQQRVFWRSRLETAGNEAAPSSALPQR